MFDVTWKLEPQTRTKVVHKNVSQSSNKSQSENKRGKNIELIEIIEIQNLCYFLPDCLGKVSRKCT